ncbi:MAG: sulfatase [Phycisphaerae bacterium]
MPNGRPNFIFILLDDLGWADLGCYGSTFHETPRLDALAQESMRFTDAYAACPVCSPTRASILTGQYPARIPLTNFIAGEARGRLLSAPYLHYLPLEHTSLAKALGEEDYATWHIGKWHLGDEPYTPEAHGFEVNVGGWRAGRPDTYFSPYQNPKLPDGPDGEYLTDRLTDEAIRLIENRDSRPFFMHLSYYAVHTPIEGKPELVEKYREKAAGMGLDKRDPMEVGEYFPCEHKMHKRVVRRRFQSDPGYAAMVQTVDTNIGRLLDVLSAEGLTDDTVVMFFSDNGGLATAEGSPTCNAPLSEGKGWMYDGGVREPLIVRAPGLTRADSICRTPITSTDFYPTMLELAGLEPMPEQHCDGVSFAPLLRGDEGFDRGPIFWHYPHYGNQGSRPACCVREGDWKLIEFFEENRRELYNLREDISEDRDLAAYDQQRVDHLSGLLHDWLKRVDANIPEPNPDWPGPPTD